MNYTFKCPACDHVVSVEAMSDDEAVEKINAEGAAHLAQVHPEMPATPEEDMKNMVRAQMQKQDAAVTENPEVPEATEVPEVPTVPEAQENPENPQQ